MSGSAGSPGHPKPPIPGENLPPLSGRPYETEDELVDEVVRLRKALQEIADFQPHGFDRLRPDRWELSDIARRALDVSGTT